jgi:TIR domain
MALKLFISYRRDDAAGHAGRVHDRLQREFGRDLLFMDVDSIPLGTNFVKVLGEEVAKCDALLAIIGPGWLDARDEKGSRRLENPDDFVRIEIGTALKRGIRVIPVLLGGTRIPKADQLPDDLKELALRNGLDVRHASFPGDMERLIRGLTGAQSPQQAAPAAPGSIDGARIGRFAGAAILSFLGLLFVFAGLTGPDTERAFLFGIPCLVVAYWLFTKK